MNVLLLNAFYPPDVLGGAEVMVRQLAEGLRRRGHRVAVLATGSHPGLHPEMLGGVRVYRAGLRNLYWHFTQQRPNRLLRLGWHLLDRYNAAMRLPLRQVIELEQPDVVLSHNLAGWSISAWDEVQAAGLPLVQVLHDYYLLCPKDTMFRHGCDCRRQCGSCAALRRRHAQASHKVRAVVGVSRFLLERFEDHGFFPWAARHVLHNRLPGSALAPTPAEHDGPLRFGYIGTLSGNKGVGWLIEQFQRLDIDATLSLAGRGKDDDEARLKALCRSPRIGFVGYRRTTDFLREIDVLVVPSLWAEPFGLVAVEACAAGRPVIASRMGGLPEIVRERVNGLLCSPDEPDSLGQAMLRLCFDAALRRQLAAQAPASVAAMTDQEAMLDEYAFVLGDAVAHGKARHATVPVR
ncbi:glycosyltransferase family 4 protein [Stutzerimonas azotifigens]|uniref:glycosyltransferase family 4 protein n=1 Tax=Stutzerimonas azotifigens TaxID=291995 RepID=UPI0003F8CA75|nr:glycosyltransferase family 4 protein [Stutzerimonas azotifigens]